MDISYSSDVLGRFYPNNVRLFRKHHQSEISNNNEHIKSEIFYNNDNFDFKNSNNCKILLEDFKNIQHNTSFYYDDYEDFLKDKYFNNCNLISDNVNKTSNYNIFYYYNFVDIIECDFADNTEYDYTSNNKLNLKDTKHFSNYNTMILSNSSEKYEITSTCSNKRFASNISAGDKIFISNRDYKIELILLEHLGKVRILVVDAFSNISFSSQNMSGIDNICNLRYILKGYHDNTLLFDNTKDKWGDNNACNLINFKRSINNNNFSM